MADRTLLLLASVSLLVAGCADADEARDTGANEMAAAGPAGASGAATALGDAQDGSLLTLGGTVVATAPDWFRLKTRDQELIVEMDDWDWYQEGRALKVGDEVTVTGRVDKGLWEQSKIEASSVFVRNLGVSFVANGADEEERTAALVQVGTASTSAQGYVSNIEGQEFTVGSTTGPVRVDISQLDSKPKLKAGDRVYTWGSLDVDAVEGVEMMAQGLAVLSADRTKKDSSGAPKQGKVSNIVG